MCKYLHQTKGITLVESLIAIFIVTIGLFGLLSMQPSAWRTTARTDYLGRAANVLARELTISEATIMNACNVIAPSDSTQTVYSSGEAAKQDGDIQFNVHTVTAAIPASSAWTVTITVSWPPLNPTGISETLVVTRQNAYRSGCP